MNHLAIIPQKDFERISRVKGPERGDFSGQIPEWAAKEIRETWKAAREAHGQMQAFRIIERMVNRLGYGRTLDNPPLTKSC